MQLNGSNRDNHIVRFLQNIVLEITLRNKTLDRLFDKVNFADYYLKTGCKCINVNINQDFKIKVCGGDKLFCVFRIDTRENRIDINIHNLDFDPQEIEEIMSNLSEFISDILVDIYNGEDIGYREFFVL